MEGLVVGRYRVTHRLGEGGMAQVWAAVHTVMNREAAVKLLLPEMSAHQQIVRRFFNEAQAAARINHPGIVEVFDVGWAPDGRAYIIMERLHGETLGERLHRAGTLPVGAATTLIRQLAGVMAAAHDHGIVHRDLKPDNIFIVPDPEVAGGERVKVLDFGVAKLAEGAGSVQTAHGAVFGTPAYMSPEQCLDARGVDHRADLYAIGCIFYRLLCGRAPFGDGGLEVLDAHLRAPPTPARRLAPHVSPQLDAVILRLLAKAPSERLPSCAALVQALGQALGHARGTAFGAGADAASADAADRDADGVPETIYDSGPLTPVGGLGLDDEDYDYDDDDAGDGGGDDGRDPMAPPIAASADAPTLVVRDGAGSGAEAGGTENVPTIPEVAPAGMTSGLGDAHPAATPPQVLPTLLVTPGGDRRTGAWWIVVAALIVAVGLAIAAAATCGGCMALRIHPLARSPGYGPLNDHARVSCRRVAP